MRLQNISRVFKDHRPEPLDSYDAYAILIAIMDVHGEPCIVYEKRASTLRNQPNEISFPGGSIEPGETAEQAAIRETHEELGVPMDKITILGEMDYLAGRDGRTIRCFVGKLDLDDPDELQPNQDEVGGVFFVPLSFFQENEPEGYEIIMKVEPNDDFPYELIPNGRKYDWRSGREQVYFYCYREWIIWGFTARITKGFVDHLKAFEMS